ncbi:MgtC/SapB family protein [Chitinophaga agrisoli]|uniref:MgtC/SapB family protein n=1 Tax=Chitinophaga agrisoli TaxID=2607653 RepID=A0A5B2VZB3_9BACT|nr:MgtC/SapB family protein [Chitinophaga agrisoli]KAA2245173.1 MgtC/SapB family protein [Chitinophaga agrisoli]
MLDTHEIILRLVVSAVLGGLVGLDRERLEWAAGLRTHMLVCLGATLTMIVSAFGFGDILGLNLPHVILDPSRVASLVISGIGFIGAGTILFLKRKVIYGLTTAAGLWTVAAIGLAVGGGMYIAAITATVITLLILIVIKQVERRFFSSNKDRSIRIGFINTQLTIASIADLLEQHHLNYDEINLEQPEKGHAHEMEIVLNKTANQRDIIKVMDDLRQLDGVKEVNFSSL